MNENNDIISTVKQMFSTSMNIEINVFQGVVIALVLAIFAVWAVIAFYNQKSEGADGVNGKSVKSIFVILFAFLILFFFVASAVA